MMKQNKLMICLILFLSCLASSNVLAQSREKEIDKLMKSQKEIKEAEKIYDSLQLNINNEGAEKQWFKIKDSQDKEVYQEFIDNFPASKYVVEALKKIQDIELEDAKEILEETKTQIDQMYEQ